MTKFCQKTVVPILLICLVGLSSPSVVIATAPEMGDSFANAPLQEMVRVNADLERQVKRLKAQVAAQRDELSSPGMTEVVGGIGYIVGIFGLLGWRAARKKSNQGVN